MNHHQTNPPHPDLSERVAGAIGAHRRKINALTGIVLGFGFLSLAASVLIVAAYMILYRPKQMQLLRDVSSAAQMAPRAPAASGDSPRRELDFPSVQASMTHVLSFGTMLVAVAVGLSAVGTLVMLGLVILQRRTTLQQVSYSLAQISAQLRELQLRSGP